MHVRSMSSPTNVSLPRELLSWAMRGGNCAAGCAEDIVPTCVQFTEYAATRTASTVPGSVFAVFGSPKMMPRSNLAWPSACCNPLRTFWPMQPVDPPFSNRKSENLKEVGPQLMFGSWPKVTPLSSKTTRERPERARTMPGIAKNMPSEAFVLISMLRVQADDVRGRRDPGMCVRTALDSCKLSSMLSHVVLETTGIGSCNKLNILAQHISLKPSFRTIIKRCRVSLGLPCVRAHTSDSLRPLDFHQGQRSMAKTRAQGVFGPPIQFRC
jgi:hypothetical protein